MSRDDGLTATERVQCGYYRIVSAICCIGCLVSLIVLFVLPPIGIIGLVLNLMALGSSDKSLKRIEDRAVKR